MRVDVPPHDSDSIIPPKAPHSFVPFSRAPSSMAASFPARSNGGSRVSGSGRASGSYTPRSGQPRSGDTHSGPGSGQHSGQYSGHGAPGSGLRDGGSSGSVALSQQGGSMENYSLPSMPWKDWELNLDALQVRPHRYGTVSVLCLTAPVSSKCCFCYGY